MADYQRPRKKVQVANSNRQPTKVGVFVTHPIQYQVPIWRLLSKHSSIDLQVFYFSRQGIEDRVDPGFGVPVKWDVDLLAGYSSRFLTDLPLDRVCKAQITDFSKALSGFEVIFLHGYVPRFARQILSRKRQYGYRIVMRGEFTDRSEFPRSQWKTIARDFALSRLYRRVEAFCYVGIDGREHLQRHAVKPRRLFFSPYSIDNEMFQEQRNKLNRSACRQFLGIGDEDVVFLFSGKMIPRKQPDMLATVSKRLARNHRLRLVMLGDGELLHSIRAELAPLVRRGKVVLPGFVNQAELGGYFEAADAFVLPSRHDTWGLVVNEAMQFGLPCLVSDRVGCRFDLVVPGRTGEIFKHDSSDELSNLMMKYLQSPELLKEMRHSVLRRIEAYSSERAAAGIVNAIEFAVSDCHS